MGDFSWLTDLSNLGEATTAFPNDSLGIDWSTFDPNNPNPSIPNITDPSTTVGDTGGNFGSNVDTGFQPQINPDGSISWVDGQGNWVGGAPLGNEGGTQGPPGSGASQQWPQGSNSGLLSGLGGIPGLASLLAPLLGGLLGYHATNKATGQVVAGINNAQNAVNQILGGQSLYAPYMNQGATALGNLANMKWSPLNYGPLGGSSKR